jgi:hypothetical protein
MVPFTVVSVAPLPELAELPPPPPLQADKTNIDINDRGKSNFF